MAGHFGNTYSVACPEFLLRGNDRARSLCGIEGTLASHHALPLLSTGADLAADLGNGVPLFRHGEIIEPIRNDEDSSTQGQGVMRAREEVRIRTRVNGVVSKIESDGSKGGVFMPPPRANRGAIPQPPQPPMGLVIVWRQLPLPATPMTPTTIMLSPHGG